LLKYRETRGKIAAPHIIARAILFNLELNMGEKRFKNEIPTIQIHKNKTKYRKNVIYSVPSNSPESLDWTRHFME
jgi:hypothetical protein